ncbi:MAG: 3-isopropylmalate dehydratase large subunit [Rhizobiaceae bacterium]|nr:3-isopropylmalate dehydratase large subunit [Rhizobiaceae bacterium]
MKRRNLFEKIWDEHLVAELDGGQSLVHIDRHLIHDLTSPQAFAGLEEAGRKVRNPELTFAVSDHMVSTRPGRSTESVPGGREMLLALRSNARNSGITHFDIEDRRQGIVHVAAPEQGIILPGMIAVCGDSHTCTLGALGCWAFGIGTSEVEHVLATQTLVVTRPKSMLIEFHGAPAAEVTAKDVALHLIARLGVKVASGFAVEYGGDYVKGLPVEARHTLCNMGVEMGAHGAMVAPDRITLDYLAGRPFAPRITAELESCWLNYASDEGASYDRIHSVELAELEPQISWGTNPSQTIAVNGVVPPLPDDPREAAAMHQSLSYMGLRAGERLEGMPVDNVFIGSCTNGRLSDLSAAASIIGSKRVAPHVRAIVVPGSSQVRRQAEELGLDRIFMDAGCEWLESGCSMCVGMNGDYVGPGKRSVSTSNRNFEGRQGSKARTHLASPLTAMASALAGEIADPRQFGAGK